ncbi:MAG: spermidine synthase [Planctomycetota bacterium]|jgi:spermidine synthase
MRTRLAILFLISFGGVAALSWEVVWQLQASLAFGISAFGTALTLAATMGGMAVGSLVMGRVLHRRTVERPFVLYGWLELVIGISGLLMLPGFALLEAFDAHVYAASPTLAPAVRVLGIAVLLGPPTFSMGATVPVFQLVARRYGASIAKLYAVNTAGAAAGVLLFSFVLLPELGVARTCVLVAGINIAVCAATWIVTRIASETPAPAPAPAGPRDAEPLLAPRISPRLAQAIVAGTGLATFGLEVTWFRALRSAFWSTSHTFAIILASVLIPLAIGARLAPWIRRRGIGPGATVAAAGVAILVVTPLVERMDLFAGVGDAGYFGTLAIWLGLSLAILGPPMVLLGMALPWCLEEFPEPRMTGRLYGVNTIGSVVGSIAAAWLLLPWLGFARASWLIGSAIIILAVPALGRAPRVVAVSAGLLALAAAWQFTSSPGRDRFQGFPDFGGHEVLAFREAPDATVSVIKAPRGNRALMIDGFAASTEGLFGAHYMRWMGSLPMLAHPRPADGLVICFGTGQTTDGVREEGIDALDVVDVSAAVFEMAPLFETNNDVLEDSKVQTIVMDGRAWLRRTTRRYDVVTLEPMPPNFAGVNSLYSQEFYEIVASRLKPGGLVAQWLPFHLVTAEHSVAIAATFVDVFPDSVLWVDPIGGTGILLGRHDAAAAGVPPLGTKWPGLWRETVMRTLDEDEIADAVLLDAAGLRRYAEGGLVITDDNQLLNFGHQHSHYFGQGISADLDKVNRDAITAAAGRAPFRIERPESWRRR